MIDPNIWGSEDMAKLSVRQRLLVIGLFSNADDHGKGKANPAYIRSIVFPYDDIPLPDIIKDLESIEAYITIIFYEVEGNSYYKFLNWEKWQTVQKPQESIIPEPVENHSLPSQEPFSPKGKEEKRKEGKGKEDKKTYAEFVKMTEEEYQKLVDQYGPNLTNEMVSVLDNYKGSKGKTYKSDYRAILSWVVEKVVEKNAQHKASRRDTGLRVHQGQGTGTQEQSQISKGRWDDTPVPELQRYGG